MARTLLDSRWTERKRVATGARVFDLSADAPADDKIPPQAKVSTTA